MVFVVSITYLWAIDHSSVRDVECEMIGRSGTAEDKGMGPLLQKGVFLNFTFADPDAVKGRTQSACRIYDVIIILPLFIPQGADM
jgi:hypothetical protein